MEAVTGAEREALQILPDRLSEAALRCASLYGGVFSEIRLRTHSPLFITSSGRNLSCGVTCTRRDIDDVIRRLTGNSLYSFGDTIREGYITTSGGLRAGVCGRAVTQGGVVSAVCDISSVCIRVPHRVRGAGDVAYGLLKQSGFKDGLLIYSAPGVGKTTLLRELVWRLAGGEHPFRVAVVDTRCEIYPGLEGETSADFLSGYPRGKGIEIAVRTLSPQFVVCDEIGSAQEAEAICEAAFSGVKLIATAHASSFEELSESRLMQELWEAEPFGIYLGLLGRERGRYTTEVSYRARASDTCAEGERVC